MKTKFLLCISALIAVAMSISTSAAYFNSKKVIRQAITKQMAQLTDSTASHIDLWMNDRKLDIMNWAEQSIYQKAISNSLIGQDIENSSNTRLKEIKQNYPYYESLNLTNSHGQIISSSKEEKIGNIDISNQPFFKETLQKNVFISSVIKSPETQRDIFVISAAVKENDIATGVLYGVIDVENFNNLFIAPIKICKSGFAYLVNSEGYIIGKCGNTSDLWAGEHLRKLGQKIAQNKNGFITYDYKSEEKIVFMRKLHNCGLLIAIGADTQEIFAPMHELWFNNIAITQFFIAISLIFVIGVYRRLILRPIECLIKGITNFGKGQFYTKIELNTEDEFASLAETFNKMADDIQRTTTSVGNLHKEIEERIKTEEEMIKLNHNLEDKNEELKNFAYIASHDLREPLRKITSFGIILKRSLNEKMTMEDQENLHFMMDGADRMNKMIEGLLAYSRVNTKIQQPQNVDLNEIVTQLQQIELSVALYEKQAVVEVPQPLPIVQADPVQIRQLMQNLIANGIKYQKQDNRPQITITAKPAADGMMKIEVTDNGIGIKPEYHSAIFAMFRRLHTSHEYEGTGIGLAVCKKIVERHGGHIGIESQASKGATFWFTVPMAKNANTEERQLSAVAEDSLNL